MCVASCVFVRLKCGLFDVQLGYVVLCNGLLCMHVDSMRGHVSSLCIFILSIAYNLVLGVLLAIKCLFNDFPHFGYIKILKCV
jgi:hypothetical protein